MNPYLKDKLPKVFIFDVGGTIFDVININFDNGLIYLYDNVIDQTKVTKEEFIKSMKEISHALRERELNNFEFSFDYFFNYVTFIYGNPHNYKPRDIEWDYSHALYQGEEIPNVIDFIKYLKDKGIKLYVLSNSMFSTPEIRLEIEEYHAREYFLDVISTGDYIFRKPSEDIFKLYIKKLALDGYNVEDLCYIGNSFRFDIVPSSRLKMNSIFFAVKEEEILNNEAYLQVNSYQRLLELFKEKFN